MGWVVRTDQTDASERKALLHCSLTSTSRRPEPQSRTKTHVGRHRRRLRRDLRKLHGSLVELFYNICSKTWEGALAI
jgi:hypothetical protein